MDLAKINKTQWMFRSDSAGDWAVYAYSMKAAAAIDEFLKSEEKDPVRGVKVLIKLICRRHVSSEVPESKLSLTEEEIDNLLPEEINRFSREFIENNTDLLGGEVEALVKGDDQTDAVFLIEVLEAHNKKVRERLGPMFQDLKSRLSGILTSPNAGLRSVTQDLIKQSENIEKAYSARTSMFKPTQPTFDLFPGPRNPTFETNDHLQEMNARLDRLIGFGENALQIMNGLQVAAAEFLEKFSKEAKNNSDAAKKAIQVGIFAVLFSIAQIIYTEFWRVPQENASTEAALATISGEIDNLRIALSSELANSKAVQETATETIARALDAAAVTNTDLL